MSSESTTSDSARTQMDTAPGLTDRETLRNESLLFNRYRTVRELGRGGMGIVQLAHDQVLDVQVALKLIPEMVVRDTEGITDLKKEVLRGMELTHPAIVRVFSFEQDANSAAIVMEFVPGATLAQKKMDFPDRCFNPEEILPWLQQLCPALDYAHREARIAHRDLKPGNLMLTQTGRLKIADFGIASSLSDTMSRVSVRADSAGTPPYMSPQQAMGERPSHLDDIYSLGATIYELLTGKPPFFRGNIIAQVLEEAPPTLSRRRAEFGILDRDSLPPEWERVVAACLSKNPTERPGSGAEIISILEKRDRAVVLSPAPPILDLKLVQLPTPAAESDSVQRIYPQPIGGHREPDPETEKPRLKYPVRRAGRDWNPLGVFSFIGSALMAIFEALGSILKVVVIAALILGAIWGALQLKGHFDAKAAADAAAARQQGLPDGNFPPEPMNPLMRRPDPRQPMLPPPPPLMPPEHPLEPPRMPPPRR